MKHGVVLVFELFAHNAGSVVGNNFTLFHDNDAVGIGKDIFQTVFRDDDSGSHIAVEFPHRFQKVRSGNGIQLGGGFIEKKNQRLHRHDGSQIQQLFLTAGKIGDIAAEPALDPEIAGHFRHAETDGLVILAEAFQTEGKLVPDFIRHDLIIGILQNIADLRRLGAEIHIFQIRAVKQDSALFLTVRGENRLQMAHQRRFPTAGTAAENDKFTLFNS